MKSIDLTGRKFGILTVVKKDAPDRWNHPQWQCSCDCGGVKVTQTGDLISGRVKSCGCLRHQTGENHPAWKGGRIEIRCANSLCNKTVPKYPSLIKLYKLSYCGNECRYAHRPETIKGKNNPRFKESIRVNCAYCGKEIFIWPCMNRRYQDHFCKDTDCKSKWCSENRKGEANSNYHGGTPEMRIIRKRIAASMRKAIRQGKAGRHWESLVDYNMTDLIHRLKSTIPQGYSWEKDFIDGKGMLHIDHKRPMSSFRFEKAEDEQFKRCFALDNLQLLPAIENMKKSAKYVDQQHLAI